MYDFCFTPLYAALLAIGGVIGFLSAGSLESLGTGLGAAALLSIFTYVSFKYFTKKKTCKPAVLASLVVSAALTFVMGQKYANGAKVHTAIIAGVSGLMSVYYVWNLLLGPDPAKAHKAAKKG